MSDAAMSVADRLVPFLVFSLPIMQPFLQVGRYPLVLTDLVFVITASCVALAIARGGLRLRLSPWLGPLGVYALTLVASAAASESPRRSAVKLLGSLYLLTMAALVAGYASDEASLRRIIRAWLGGTAVTVAATLCGLALFAAGTRAPDANMFLMGFGSLPPGPYPRVMALFQNANMMCTFAVASAAMIPGARSTGWIGAAAAWTLLAGTVVAAAFSVSPGLGGLFLALGVWYRASRLDRPAPGRWAVAGGAAGAAAFLGAMLVSPPSAVQGLRASIPLWQWAPSSRMMTWQDAWQTFLSHPWLGRGLGLEAADVRYLNASGSLELLTDAHNTWLSILAQNGIVAAVAFAGVTGFLVRRFRLFSPAASRLRELRVALEAAFLGGVLYQTLNGSWENTRHVWVLMALVAAVQELDADVTDAPPGAWRPTVAA